MNLEDILNDMPEYILSNGKKYNLFITKGTQKSCHWTVGYSNYEREHLGPFTEKNLVDGLMRLREKMGI